MGRRHFSLFVRIVAAIGEAVLPLSVPWRVASGIITPTSDSQLSPARACAQPTHISCFVTHAVFPKESWKKFLNPEGMSTLSESFVGRHGSGVSLRSANLRAL